jgi:hypothetical protein
MFFSLPPSQPTPIIPYNLPVHANALDPECTATCLFSECSLLNRFGQMGQQKEEEEDELEEVDFFRLFLFCFCL